MPIDGMPSDGVSGNGMSGDLPSLARRLRALTARRPGLAACVWGEAGIGKTHATSALLRDTPCRSVSVHATVPLPDLIRALPRAARLPAWTRAALESVVTGREVMVPPADLLAALLGQLAPFVLLLEDLHDADPARTELVGQLADAVTRARGVALLVSRRTPPQAWPDSALVIPVQRLSPAHTAALLDAEVGAALPAEAAAWVYGRALGNPLFTLEYFRLLARQGHLWNSGERWRWRAPQRDQPGDRLPVTVEAVIEQELYGAGVSAAAGALMAALAILPHTTSDAHLGAIAGLPPAPLEAARLELRRRGVLAQGHFAHPLYREVAFGTLTAGQRQELARRATRVFSADPGVTDELSTTLIDMAQLEPQEAARLLLSAADTAQPGPHHAQLVARAADYASGTQRVQLALRAAQELSEHDQPGALHHAEIAARLAPDLPEAAHLYARLLASEGRLPEAEAWLNRLPATERTGLAWWSRLIKLRGTSRDHRGVMALWDAHPEFHDKVLAQEEASVVARVAFACANLHDLEQARALATQALSWPGVSVPLRCDLLNVLGIVCYQRNDFEKAARHYDHAVQEARAARPPHLEAVYLSNRAMALGEMGQLGARLADLETSLSLFLERGHLLQAARTQVALSDTHLDLAHHAQAEELLLDARDFLIRLEPSEHLVECEYRLSVLYRHWGSPHGGALSLKYARSGLEHARLLGVPAKLAWALCYAAIAESCFAAADTGRRLAAEALEATDRLGAPGPRGMAHFAWAFALEAAGETSEALRAFETAEAELLALNVGDAAREVGLEADRLAHRPAQAAERLAWFMQAGQLNLAHVTCRYFPELCATGESGSPAPARAALPRLDVLGEMRLGDPATGAPAPVRGRRRRELLACLLEGRLRGRPEVPRLTLTDALYPQADEARGVAALKELVHQTRATLGAGVIRTTESGYALGDLHSDAEDFLHAGNTHLWRGPYLTGVELDADHVIHDTLCRALHERAAATLADDPAEAARVARVLRDTDPYDAAALALHQRALRAAGNHRTLGRVYTQAQAAFNEVGESLPGDWNAFLDGQQAERVT
ncbi:AAA family ATPase [Deinococcus sp.]|uniref:AAA family ATPase n=1 Tax=Deinococcus sp. TaxID=47478 RepID=UPI0028699B0E|nr:AAA family ATPase [Deinococcus sp.]